MASRSQPDEVGESLHFYDPESASLNVSVSKPKIRSESSEEIGQLDEKLNSSLHRRVTRKRFFLRIRFASIPFWIALVAVIISTVVGYERRPVQPYLVIGGILSIGMSNC